MAIFLQIRDFSIYTLLLIGMKQMWHKVMQETVAQLGILDLESIAMTGKWKMSGHF